MKLKCGVLIDSSCTYAQDFIDNNHIEIIPLSLSDEQQHVYPDDIKIISQQELLKRLNDGEIFRTSATPLGQLTLKIEDMMEKYESVIFLPISTGLSSQYQQSLIIKNDFPDRLFVIPSQSAVFANEIVLNNVVRWINEGKDPKQIVNDAEKIFDRTVTLFSCENSSGILRGGRGNKAIFHAIKFLKLKPIIQLDKTNQYAGIATNYKSSNRKIINFIKNSYKGIKLTSENILSICIYYSGYDDKKKNYLIDSFAKAFNFPAEKIIVRWLPATVLVHTLFGSYGATVETTIEKIRK